MVQPTYEDLKLAHEVMGRGPNRTYWEREPVPFRPLGRVFLEPLRQLSTFVVPITLVAWCAYEISIYTIVTTIPLAFLLGYLLDRHLTWSIKRKRAREQDRDRGRYYAVRILSHMLSVPPSEITLEMIERMSREYVAESNKRAYQEQRRADAERIAEGKRRVSPKVRSASGSLAGAALAAAAIETSYSDSIIDEPSMPHWENQSWSVNPGTGLPMAGADGLGVDVGGNPFGTGY